MKTQITNISGKCHSLLDFCFIYQNSDDVGWYNAHSHITHTVFCLGFCSLLGGCRLGGLDVDMELIVCIGAEFDEFVLG